MKKLLVSGLIVSFIAILGSARISEPLILLLLIAWIAFAARQLHSLPSDFSEDSFGIL